MTNLKNLELQVKDVMMNFPETRSNDMLLCKIILLSMCMKTALPLT